MAQTPRLKLICIAATGMNNVDTAFATTQNIIVKNVAGYSTHGVVQHTFAMLFYLLQQMSYYPQVAFNGAWHGSKIFTDISKPFYEIYGKQWGIIGLGVIGQEVAKIASAFGAVVVYYSTSGKNCDHDYPNVALDELLSTCDIVSIHAPLNDQTKYLLNAQNLVLLKPNAILLNLGRGGIIHEGDLATILDQKEIFVGLDVLEKEPIEPTNPLLKIRKNERLLITPHIAWTSKEARAKLLKGVVDNIKGLK